MESQDSPSNKMNLLANRLDSFVKLSLIYHLSNDMINKLSKTGVYYTGRNKDLICHFCKRHWNNWNNISDIIDDHQKHSPSCADSDNVNNGATPDDYGVQETAHCLSNTVNMSPVHMTATQHVHPLNANTQETVESRPRHPRFVSGDSRLDSFPTNWHNVCPISSRSLAAAGFIYQGPHGDRVKCFHCGEMLHKWEPGDDPWKEHKRWSPNCHFKKSNDAIATKDKAGHCLTNTTSGSEEHTTVTQQVQPSNNNTHNTAESRPRHPNYESRDSRIDSFPADWHNRCPISPRSLAAAGLFCKGSGDRVMCFHCGGILHTWEPDEDPWEEHARWFPDCQFARARMSIHVSQKKSNGAKATKDKADNQNSFQLLDPNLLTLRTVRSDRAISLQRDVLTRRYKEIIALRKANTDLQQENARLNKDLAEQKEELDRSKKCLVCFFNDRCMLLLPCKHFIICEECVPKLVNKKCLFADISLREQ